jgi:hypothetical protein
MDDAAECLSLLETENALLKHIISETEKRLEPSVERHELALFVLTHAWNVYELAKAAILLTKAAEPFAVAILARSALESTFNMLAAARDKSFGPQKLAREWEELAGKFEFFIKSGSWDPSRKPTPEQCRQTADQIRKKYAVVPEKAKPIEQIARLAELSPYYDDDYRWLSLLVHANQVGIHNTAAGFLSRKGSLALANAIFITANGMVGLFCLGKAFDSDIADLQAQLDTMLSRPDNLPPG